MVMGFPHSGPFEAGMARVRERITIAGPDIYSKGRVERGVAQGKPVNLEDAVKLAMGGLDV